MGKIKRERKRNGKGIKWERRKKSQSSPMHECIGKLKGGKFQKREMHNFFVFFFWKIEVYYVLNDPDRNLKNITIM
jgi:hypothetical protein